MSQLLKLFPLLVLAGAVPHRRLVAEQGDAGGPASSYSFFSMLSDVHSDVRSDAYPDLRQDPVQQHHQEPAIYQHEEPAVLDHPKYTFRYGVRDPHTKDIKSQSEERDGDVVKGEYSLLQPDGRTRHVHYIASKHGGFHAIVTYSGQPEHNAIPPKENHATVTFWPGILDLICVSRT